MTYGCLRSPGNGNQYAARSRGEARTAVGETSGAGRRLGEQGRETERGHFTKADVERRLGRVVEFGLEVIESGDLP